MLVASRRTQRRPTPPAMQALSVEGQPAHGYRIASMHPAAQRVLGEPTEPRENRVELRACPKSKQTPTAIPSSSTLAVSNPRPRPAIFTVTR